MTASEVIEIGDLHGGERKQGGRQAALAHYTGYLNVLAPPSHQAETEQWAADFFRETTLDTSFSLERYKELFKQMFHVNLQELAGCCGRPERCLHVLELFAKLRGAFAKEFDSNCGDIICASLKTLKDGICGNDFDPARARQLSAVVNAALALMPAEEPRPQETEQPPTSSRVQIEAALDDLVRSYFFSPVLSTAFHTRDLAILKEHFELFCAAMGPQSAKIGPEVLFSKGVEEIGKEIELLDTLAADLVRSEERYYKEFGKKRFKVIRSAPVEFEALAQVARREARHLPKIAKLAQSCHELQTFLTGVEELGSERKARPLPAPLSELGKKASAILEKSAWRLEVYSDYLPAVLLASPPEDPNSSRLARIAHRGIHVFKPRFESARAQLQNFAGWASS